jgi:hypothetical protein
VIGSEKTGKGELHTGIVRGNKMLVNNKWVRAGAAALGESTFSPKAVQFLLTTEPNFTGWCNPCNKPWMNPL